MAAWGSLALLVLLALSSQAHGADKPKKGPKVTNKVYFDVSIDDEPAGKL